MRQITGQHTQPTDFQVRFLVDVSSWDALQLHLTRLRLKQAPLPDRLIQPNQQATMLCP